MDDAILPYVQFFVNNQVNGCRLLLLTSDDLENLNVKKIGHQEIILEAVDLLKHLHYSFASETLQSQALRLGCKARSLCNQIKHDEQQNMIINTSSSEIYSKDGSSMQKTLDERVSTATLSSVSDILLTVKSFISWIDRYPFSSASQLNNEDGSGSVHDYSSIRLTILRRSIELASTAQRDQFVDQPNMIIKESCSSLAELCDQIVQELNDSLAISPANLEGEYISLFYQLFSCCSCLPCQESS